MSAVVERAEALAEFAEVWSDGMLHEHIGEKLTCREAEALAGALSALGVSEEVTDWLIQAHSWADEEGDLHYESGEVATYHGITKVECLICGHTTTDVTTMELWNDYGATCMEGNHETGVTRWTLADGTVRVVTQSVEGDLATYTTETGESS